MNVRMRALAAAVVLVLAGRVTAAAPAKSKAFIWKVTSPTTTVYVMGSMHAGTADMYPLAPEIEAAFAESGTLAVEADITKADQEGLAKVVMEKGMYGEGDSLQKHVSAETWKAFEAYCTKNQVPTELLVHTKPWMAALGLTEMAVANSGLEMQYGIDKHFLESAKGKKIVELESVGMQMDLLSGLDDKMQEAWLKMTITEAEGLKEEFEKMMKAWSAGDAKTIEEISTASYKDGPEGAKLLDVLITSRNAEMAEKVGAMLRGKEKVFVVVGAAHLVGEKGLVRVLQTKGFKVEQMMVTKGEAPAKH